MMIACPNICAVVYSLQGFTGLGFISAPLQPCVLDGASLLLLANKEARSAPSQPGLLPSAPREGCLEQETSRCEQGPLGTIWRPVTALALPPAGSKSLPSGSPSLCPHLSRSDDLLQVTLGPFSYPVLSSTRSLLPYMQPWVTGLFVP